MRGDASVVAALVSLGAIVTCVRAPAAPTRPAPATLELPTVALVPHDTLPTGTIRGRVTTDHPACPTAGATVELPDAKRSVRVDTAGAFELRGVPPGRQRLHARRIGCRRTIGSIDVPARGGSVVRVHLEAQVLCLDYCPPEVPRAFGRIEAIP
jgi:hypothetical protein